MSMYLHRQQVSSSRSKAAVTSTTIQRYESRGHFVTMALVANCCDYEWRHFVHCHTHGTSTPTNPSTHDLFPGVHWPDRFSDPTTLRYAKSDRKRKGRGPVLDRALLRDEHNAQERFTISEMAADWHELMIPQRIMPALANNRTCGAACRHTTAPVSYITPSPRSPYLYYSFPLLPASRAIW